MLLFLEIVIGWLYVFGFWSSFFMYMSMNAIQPSRTIWQVIGHSLIWPGRIPALTVRWSIMLYNYKKGQKEFQRQFETLSAQEMVEEIKKRVEALGIDPSHINFSQFNPSGSAEPEDS